MNFPLKDGTDWTLTPELYSLFDEHYPHIDIDVELKKMREGLVTEEELQRSKNKMRSSFYSAIEDSYSIAYWGVKQRLFKCPSIEEYIDKIDLVTREDVRDVANILLDEDQRLTMICRGESGE